MLNREVYDKGQLVIPKFIREMCKLGSGAKVSFSVEGNRIVITKQHSVAEEFEKMAAGSRGKKVDLSKEHDAEMLDRMKRLGINVSRR